MSCYMAATKLMFNNFAENENEAPNDKQLKQAQINNLFVKACDLNLAPACSALAAQYFVDSVKSMQYLIKACNLKDSDSCYSLARTYQKAINNNEKYIDNNKQLIVPNKTEVAKIYTKACTDNDADSCYQLGLLYETGFGVNKDSNKADTFIIKSCELESSSGCKAIAYRTFARYQITNDKTYFSEAVNYFNKACNLYDKKSCKMAADLYFSTEEFNKAVKLYQKACFSDDGESCYKVGSQLMTGAGCPLDTSLAKKYFVISCINDYEPACKLINPDDQFEYYEYARIIREAPWF